MSRQRILLLTFGTRGDVQPFMALALGLHRAGYHVRVLTTADFVGPFQAMGVEAVDTWHFHFDELLVKDEIALRAMATGDALKFLECHRQNCGRHFPAAFARQLEEIRGFRPDLIMHGVLDCWETFAVATAMDIPCLYAGMSIVHPTGHAQSALGEPRWVGRRMRLVLSTFAAYMFFRSNAGGKGDTVRRLCPEATPFLPTAEGFMHYLFHPVVQWIYGLSPVLTQLQPDWPRTFRPVLTGAWVVEADEQVRHMRAGAKHWGGEEASRLEAFLAEGRAPVYLGWGSMVSVSAEYMVRLAVRTLMAVEERGIVLAGVAGLSPEMLPGQPDSDQMLAYVREKVLFVGSAPHEMLFPRCAVTVHHGGAGTTTAALRSGVPTVVTPVWLDQFPNADKVVSKGSGIKTRPLMKVSVEELAAAVRRCLTDKEIQSSARVLGAQLRSEDGVAAAVQEVRRVMSEEVATGMYRERLDVYKRKMAAINARPTPSCFVWLRRVFLSREPNGHYDVRLPCHKEAQDVAPEARDGLL